MKILQQGHIEPIRLPVLVLMFLGWLMQPALAQQLDDRFREHKLELIKPADSLLAMQEYAPHPEADYLYADKLVDIHFEQDEGDITAVLQYRVMLKILSEEGQQASVVGIPYYFDRDVESVAEIAGRTYQPDGSTVELDTGKVKTVNLNARYNLKEFTLPDAKPGSVLEYRYTLYRQYIEELPDIYFSHGAPTVKAEVRMHDPRYLRYNAVPVNMELDKELKYHKTEIDTSSVQKIFTVPQPEPLTTEHWVARNLPAVRDVAYLSSPNDYRAKLKFQLSEFGIPRQSLENSWELVVARLRRNRNPWEYLEKNGDAIDSISDAWNEQLDGLGRVALQDSLYRRINRRMTHNGFKSIYSKLSPDSVITGVPADQSAVNLTLMGLLRNAGIEARPMLISTRQSGQINRAFPSLFQFNGLILYTEINGQPYFMDASFPHSYPNLIPVDVFNENGLLLGRDSFDWKSLNPKESEFNIEVETRADLQSDGTLEGSVHSEQSGYSGQVIRKNLAEGQAPEEVVKKALLDGYTKLELDSVRIRNINEVEMPIVIDAHFMLPDYAVSYTSGLEFRPLVVGSLMRNPFQQATRNVPVTLDAPEHLNLSYRIQLPRGFAYDERQSNQEISLPGARLQERYDVRSRELQYNFKIDLTRKTFPVDLYPQLRDLYERWVDLSTGKWFINKQ